MKPKVLRVKDCADQVPTSKYPYAKFPYTYFNQAQSRVFESYDKDVNYVIAVPTGTGKTISGEMFLSHTIRKEEKRGMYLSPSRALSQEKYDNWKNPDHHFSDLNISICTGDYKTSPDRKKELDNSDLIIMTSEMLNSKCRNYKSEHNNFLQEIGVLVIDEFHKICTKDRGSHIESAIMKFTSINPESRIIALSATMFNVSELGEWISRLNGKDTYVLESTYRACPLKVHYVKYQDIPFGYNENEATKVKETIRIVRENIADKFILFVHTKKTGELLLNALHMAGIDAAYHNADLSKENRTKVESRFKDDPKLRCIVSTSTLAEGINMPARRVVVVGVHRGINEVEVCDVFQMIGRSGRPQFDTQGDAYILLPTRSFKEQKERLEAPQIINSQIVDSKTLAFHITSDIHHRDIKTTEDIHNWYERSLAHHQMKELDDKVVSDVIKILTRCGAIVNNDKIYETTSIGTVSSMFYFSPFDISDLCRNWNNVFSYGKETDDRWIAMALANVDSMRMGIASNADKEEMSKFSNSIDDCEKVLAGKNDFTDGAIKYGCCYHNLLKGYNSPLFAATMRGLQMDFERVSEVLCTLDQMTGKWNQREYFKKLYLRILYGVEAHIVDLCRLKNVGRVKAKRLWDANLRTLEQISTNVLGVIKSLNCSKKVAEGIAHNAKTLILTGE